MIPTNRTARSSAAWLATAGLVGASIVGVGAAGLECGSASAPLSADASADVAADAPSAHDAEGASDASVDAVCMPNSTYDPDAHAPYDAASTCDAGFIGDGEVVSDWPGWVRPAGIEACCKLDVPMADAGLPPLAWHPCATGPTGCEEWLPVGPLVAGESDAIVIKAQASRSATGEPLMLALRTNGMGNLSGVLQDLFFDIATGESLGAWRTGFSSVNDHSSDCITYSAPAGDSVALAWQNWFTLDMGLAFGTPATLMAGPGFASLVPNPRDTPRYWGTSATKFAFDTPFTAVVAQSPLGSGVVTSTPPCAPPLVFDFVEGNDVFARLNDTSKWQIEYLVHDDGSVTVYRAVANHHVSAFATDGTTMFWVESYGPSDPTATQTSFDVYAAPYTADATTLNATAVKIASANSSIVSQYADAFGGIYAFSGGNVGVNIVRLSDHATQVVQLPPGESFYAMLFATQTEFWGTVSATSQHNIAVWRVPLAAW